MVEDAVNAITNAEFVFGRLEMNVRRAVLEGFPNDLVDEFDDARFLVAFGNLLVFADDKIDRLVFGHFIKSLGADRRTKKPIEFLMGAYAMQVWGIELDMKHEKLDMSHYSKEFTEYTSA